jgi:hypothetical protein
VVVEEVVAIILDPLRVMGEPAAVVEVEVIIMQVQVDLEQSPADQEHKIHQLPMAVQVEQILEEAVGVLVELVVEQPVLVDQV